MKILFPAVVVACLGSASAALATESFDVNIYQPVFQGNELSANAWVAPQNRHRHMAPAKEPLWDAQEALFRRMARPE
jgi:hypothetical protein